MMLPAGESERLLLGQYGEQLMREARDRARTARDVPGCWSELLLDVSLAATREAGQLRDQLDRAKRRRPPRGGRSRS